MHRGVVYLRTCGLFSAGWTGSGSSSSGIVTGVSKTAHLGDFFRQGFNRLGCKPFQHLECDGAESSHRKRSVVLLHQLLRDTDMGGRQLARPRGSVIILGFAWLAAQVLLIHR